jgi:hypothetical protein
MPILPGTWTDVTRRGRIVRTVGASVWTDEQAIPAPDVLMFLRADEDASGKLVIVGKAHSDGRGWLWRESGQTWVDLGLTYGNHCVETDGTRVYVQRSLETYDVIDLTPGGTSYQVHCAPTSQGFCDCTSPLGILSDDVRSVIPGIYRPQAAGPWMVGGARIETDVLAVGLQGPRLVEAGVAPVEETRAAFVDGELICCAYVAAGVWTWRGTPTEMPAPPPVTPPPIVPPSPPTEPPMSANLLTTITSVRAQYGATMTDDECVALCNEVAWLHRAEGYGLSHKAGGTHGTRYDGEPCCHDVLMKANGSYWDILGAAGAASIPTWQDSPNGVITDPSRYWVAPIVPQGGVVVPPVDPPPSGGDLEARVARLEAWAGAFRG